MQDPIREKGLSGTAALHEVRSSTFAEVRTLLKQQLDHYGVNSVRWAVMKRTLESLDLLEKSAPSRPQVVLASVKATPLLPKHRLHGFPCPACGRSLSTTLRGGVTCQNGHNQP